MKFFNTLLATIVAMFIASSAFAADVANTEAYAHPTLFGETLQTPYEGNYYLGNKVVKADGALTIQDKENVLVDAMAQTLLADLKTILGESFDANSPVLRGEMAHALAAGLNMPKVATKYQYKDVAGHKLQCFIYRALGSNVMIGYPDKNFRPDQKITKAEVFATLAQLLTDVKTDKSLVLGQLAGKYEMQEIPVWAIAPTKKVMAAGILDNLPNLDKVASEKYLTTEQLYKLVCTLSNSKYYNAAFVNATINTSSVRVKIKERVDARHSNIGESFYAETLEDAIVAGTTFAAGSTVKGEIVEVVRPGVKNPGYVKVKFNTIECDGAKAEIPTNAVAMDKAKTTNFVARLVAAPFSIVGRVGGVAARTISAGATELSNDGERYLDNWSNAAADTFSLQPMAGLRNVGKSFLTVGYYVYDTAKLAVSGTFGVLYELGDEVRYLILPSSVNDSALNPGDELTVIYNK